MRLYGFLGLVALSAACGASPASTTPGTLREFLVTANQINCEAKLRCCGTVCSDNSDDAYFKQYSRVQDFVAAGLLRFDPAAASACLSSMVERNKVCDLALTEVPATSTSCDKVVLGNAPAGGICENVSGVSTCAADTTCNGGSCVAKARVGESCATLTCVPGSYCDAGMGQPTCKAANPAGQACTSNSQCVTGTFCESVARVCTAYSTAGQPCSATKMCDPNVSNLYCLPNNVCGGPQSDGAPCTSSNHCKSGRCSTTGTGTGSCQPHPTPRTYRDSLCSLT